MGPPNPPPPWGGGGGRGGNGAPWGPQRERDPGRQQVGGPGERVPVGGGQQSANRATVRKPDRRGHLRLRLRNRGIGGPCYARGDYHDRAPLRHPGGG